MTSRQPLDDTGGAWDLAMYRLELAKNDLSGAEVMFGQKYYRIANSRAYYAIFHSLSACMALEFKAFKSHGQTIGNFNKDFIHTGKFPADWNKKISEAQEIRNSSDYEDFYIVSVEKTRRQLETAREVVVLVEKYLLSLKEEQSET